MSTKHSFILTEPDNEHWYHDYADDTMNIEINDSSMLQMHFELDGQLYIKLNPRSNLSKALSDFFFDKFDKDIEPMKESTYLP